MSSLLESPARVSAELSAEIKATLAHGQGVLRLLPTWVPRRFGQPGRRLRLHPDDDYALGVARGAIKERWLSSVMSAQNGPLAPPEEGMSRVLPADGAVGRSFTLLQAQEVLAAELIGPALMASQGGWPIYSKFFDYAGPLFHHLHLGDEAARRVGRRGKPEAYFFPVQMNNHLGSFPASYFGFAPDVSQGQVRERLAHYTSTDNRITELSRAFRIELGTGWYTPPGVVHAPGSVLTYEPQCNSDVNAVFENVASGETYPIDFLVENCPPESRDDLDYVLSLMDWEKNVDPHYRSRYFRPPLPYRQGPGWTQRWIVYGNPHLAAIETVLQPGASLMLEEPFACGCIVIQGHGRLGPFPCASATLLRFGQASEDEFFISHRAARDRVRIENQSTCEPLVMLRHLPAAESGAPAVPSLHAGDERPLGTLSSPRDDRLTGLRPLP